MSISLQRKRKENNNKNSMRKYVVKWYDCNLTERLSRKFFTEAAANLFAWYIEYTQDVTTKIYKYE